MSWQFDKLQKLETTTNPDHTPKQGASLLTKHPNLGLALTQFRQSPNDTSWAALPSAVLLSTLQLERTYQITIIATTAYEVFWLNNAAQCWLAS